MASDKVTILLFYLDHHPPVPRLSLLLAVLLLGGCDRPNEWNVLLVTLDTTRADRIGAYGKPNAGTGTLDQLASEGFLFEQNIASNPVTQPSHTTILTGTWPMKHGVRDNILFKIPDEMDTLAELLKQKGYATGAAIGGFPLVRGFGSEQGFDFYDDRLGDNREDFRGDPRRREAGTGSWYDERPAAHVNDAILPWLRRQFDQDQPFFAWLHYWDPHHPHIAPAPYSEIYAFDAYQAEIAYVDEQLGHLLEVLKQAGQLDNTLVVVTADHGESMGEHNEETHAFLAYQSSLHVPLIMRIPAQQGNVRIMDTVSNIDIAATIFDFLDFEQPDGFQGRSLKPLMLSKDHTGNEYRSLYSESMSPKLSHGYGALRALYKGPYKYIHGPRAELFNLSEDPDERHNLIAEQGELAGRFRQELQKFIQSQAASTAASAVFEVDEDVRKRLEGLGYLSSSGEEDISISEELSEEGDAPQDRVEMVNMMFQMRNQLSAGQYASVKHTALRLLQLDPGNAFIQAKLARSYLGLSQLAEAVKLVQQTNSINAANSADFLAVAKRLYQEDPLQGLELANKVQLAYDSAEAHALLAYMAEANGDFPSAEKQLQQALELQPDNRSVRIQQARLYTISGQYNRAEPLYLELLKESPLNYQARLDFARMLRKKPDANQALKHTLRLLRLLPRSCDVHFEHIHTLKELGKNDEAQQAWMTMRAFCNESDKIAQVADLF